MLVVALALAVMPARGVAQTSMGVTVRVVARAEQPSLVASAPSAEAMVTERVPAGWAVSVSRGSGPAPAPELRSGRAVAVGEVAALTLAGATMRPDVAESVTWTFVPL